MGVLAVAVLLVACSGESAGDASAGSTTEAPTPTAAPTTTTTAADSPTSPAAAVCEELAEPVAVLDRAAVANRAGPDLEQLSSRDAWDRSIDQHEANAAAMDRIARVVPEVRAAAEEAAAGFAELAAAGRSTEPDLALIDRARSTSRTAIDPVVVGTGVAPPDATGGGGVVHQYVQRTCPHLLGAG